MIGLVGLNHDSAPVELRERFVFDEPEIRKFLRALQNRTRFAEGVVLSTCNRTELYFNSVRACAAGDSGELIERLCDFKGVAAGAREHFYSFLERPAAAHLFRVAAGLNSMVLGENQVLGQVKEAYRISAAGKFTATVLNRLFHKAFEVGKTVRTDTAINQGASSVGYAAVELASRIFTDLAEHPVLLIGAGETGESVLQSLVQRGTRHVHVANRTAERARELARRYGAEAVDLAAVEEQFVHCDIIITSTSSRTPLVMHRFMRQVMEQRRQRSLFLIDFSVPRDVEEAVRGLEEVFVYDIDDLQMVVARNQDRRRGEIEKAERIVNARVDEFFAWLATLDLAPTISRLKERLQSISERELRVLERRLPQETFLKVREYGQFLQGKYLGLIVKNLRDLSADGRRPDYVDLVNNLFEIRSPEQR